MARRMEMQRGFPYTLTFTAQRHIQSLGCSTRHRAQEAAAATRRLDREPSPVRFRSALAHDASFAKSGGQEEPGFPGGGPSVFGHCWYCQ
jgi:hypothetical protein